MTDTDYDQSRAVSLSGVHCTDLVVFENSEFWVVDKPFDLEMDGNRPLSLRRMLQPLFVNDGVARFCHQLDYATSGLVLVAKSRGAAARARRVFDDHTITKWYDALVEGRLSMPVEVSEPIEELPNGSVRISGRGRSAMTKLQPVEFGEYRGESTTYIRAYPVTGRRHQIRLHLVHCGHRIVGDMRYGGSSESYRMMLHAAVLECPELGLDRVESRREFQLDRVIETFERC